LRRKKWFAKVELAVGDLENSESIEIALADIDLAYYLG